MFSCATFLFLLLLLLVQDGNCVDFCTLNATQSAVISQTLKVPADVLCESSKKFKFTETAGTNASEVMNLSNPTKIIIHGWINNGGLPWIRQMAANLHQTESCNVLAVDWSQAASLGYPQATASVRAVGNIVGDFIIYLKTQLSKIHVIGHSLGAQVGAFAAKRVIASTSGKISRLSGLDAAAPGFEPAPPENRIDKTDADFVELFHTSGVSGVQLNYGCMDCYFNGGTSQPNCRSLDLSASNSCSHQWAHAYYSFTILDPHKYLACSNPATATLGLCRDQTAYVGYGATANSCGSYYIDSDKNGDPIKPAPAV